MNNEQEKFWHTFKNGDLEQALQAFSELEREEQLEILQGLFQQSANSRAPFLISVLRRKLLAQKSFDDFYNAWFPAKEVSGRATTPTY